MGNTWHASGHRAATDPPADQRELRHTSASWAEVTALLCSGQITLSPLVTHCFPLESYDEAYRVLRESTGPRGKVMLDVSEP